VIGIGISDTLHNGDLALVEHRFEGLHLRIEAEVVIEREHVVLRHGERWAHLIVERIAVGNNTVEPIVAALQVDQEQHAIVTAGQSGKRRVGESTPEHVIHVGYYRET
jgi:hypothetical protein